MAGQAGNLTGSPFLSASTENDGSLHSHRKLTADASPCQRLAARHLRLLLRPDQKAEPVQVHSRVRRTVFAPVQHGELSQG